MAFFKSYNIQHLQLNEAENFSPAKGNYYVVIWVEKIPLGYVWLHAKKIFQQAIFFNEVSKAIYSSIEYYMKLHGDDEWKNLLSENKFTALEIILSQSVHYFKTTLNQHQTEKISVVICTRNRAKALYECLSSLSKINDKNVEIIVVDNASDNDDTKVTVEQFKNVLYIFESRKGLDIARNTGVQKASFDIIAYTDDDVKIPADWIDNIRLCFSDVLTMAVTGIVLPDELNTYAQYIFEKDWSFNKGYIPTVFDHSYFLKHKAEGVRVWDVGAGANMAFRRQIFNLAGLFDERLDVGAAGCSGDSEMWYRILAEGWNCIYFPHLYVFHQHRKTLKDLRKQLFSYMKGHVAALLIQHEKYGHEGNIKRIKKTLPKYYCQQIKQNLLKLFSGQFYSILTEIKGCIDGQKFYKAHNHFSQKNSLEIPRQLFCDVAINDALVSVIIPCYNQAKYLTEAIESILHQTYKKTEIIVINDGSDDSTEQVCKKYENVQHVYVERVGLSAARNIGVQFSTGSFVVFLDADDFLYEGAIELNLYFFSQNPKVVFVSGAFDKIDAAGDYLEVITTQPKADLNYLSLLQGNYIAMEGAVMYRRDLFFYFHFDTKLQSCEDYDLNLKISHELPVYHHEKKIAVYRLHGANMSGDTTRMLKSALAVLQTQKPFLKTKDEETALKEGIKNWKEYYTLSNID